MAGYSIRKTYGRLLDMFEAAFRKEKPLFTLPIYYPLAWYKGDDKSIDPFEENRQRQVVGLRELLGYAQQRQLKLWGEDGEEEGDEDIVPQEMLDAVERLDRMEFDVPEMIQETFLDLDQIVRGSRSTSRTPTSNG